MSFIVSGDTVKAWGYNLSFNIGGCSVTQTTIYTSASVAIAGGGFSSTNLSGSFQSPTSATGTIDWSANVPGCGSAHGWFVWTASKQ